MNIEVDTKRKLLQFCMILVSVFFLSACEPKKAEYETLWHDDVNAEIIITLAKNKIRGCGHFKYKANVNSKGDYIVYCTRDNISWTAYIVFTYSQKVLGPYSPSPEFD